MRQHNFLDQKRGWHCEVLNWDDSTKIGKVCGHGLGIVIGDELLLKHSSGTGRYIIKTLRYMNDPKDQFFADIMFVGIKKSKNLKEETFNNDCVICQNEGCLHLQEGRPHVFYGQE